MKDFKFEWERFLNGFDSLEEIGKWDVDEHGEMETFCENVLKKNKPFSNDLGYMSHS